MDIGIILLFDGRPGNTLAEVPDIARSIEDLGFTHLWLPDHVALFERYAPNYPYSPDRQPPLAPTQGWYDPLTTLAAAACATSRLRLGTNILILPERNPVILAQQITSLDHLCSGRLDLGIGLGWSPEEYAALNIPFARRGARADDYLTAMKRLWQDLPAGHRGEFISFNNVIALPKPLQRPHPPVLIGGNSAAALRRAARYGDGWISWMLPEEELPRAASRLAKECAALGRDAARLRRVHGLCYTTAESLVRYTETAREYGADEIAVLPWVSGRDPRDVIEEIAALAGDQ
ncbi:TIGR03619 family F420-dependent LLM class oxidoreductase [Streptomyces sp. NPDC053079]|uniref:TIGR03619 family F420-dependent LLM class oxidoreductase n=1 Tax=Streptomyces sp. NPDC053079 TaxID=3365697 RepID=UPI0037D52326